MPHKTPHEQPTVVPYKNSQQQLVDDTIDILRDVDFDNASFLWTGGKEAQVIADLLLYSVGDTYEESPIPFVVIDTGNPFPEMELFRDKYVSKGSPGPESGIDSFHVMKYAAFVDGVLRNHDDPRGYHGEWDNSVSVPDDAPVDSLPDSPSEWTVEASCGAAKVVPMRRLIESGVDTLVTGRRSQDPITPGDKSQLNVVRRVSEPRPHTRINPLSDWSESNVYAYLKSESVPLCGLYTERGYRHTDSVCCTDDSTVGEHGEGGRDNEKLGRRKELEEMGYV